MKSKTTYRITTKRKAVLISTACFLLYSLSYTGRLNYSAALPYILKSHLVTKPQGGMISTAYFMAYGIGQLINGAATDKTQPERRILTGSIGIVIMNAIMPVMSSFHMMLLVWLVNGFFESMLWAPNYSLLVSSLQVANKDRYIMILNTACAFGSILSYIISALLLTVFSWRSLFWSSSVLIAVGLAVFFILCRTAQSGCEKIVPEHVELKPEQGQNKYSFLNLLNISGVLILILAVMINGMLKDGTTNWGPTFISEVYSLAADKAVALSIIPQIANLLAATFAYWLYSRLHNEIKCVIVMFCFTFSGLGGMILFGNKNEFTMIALFALVIVSMQAANVVFVSQMPIHFQKYGKLATVSGMFDAVAYIGCAISMYLVALISDDKGWGMTIVFWFISSIAAIAISAAVYKKWKSFISRS
jgi:sugar phosphate permease